MKISHKFVTSPDILVTLGKKLVANVTVLGKILSPVLASTLTYQVGSRVLCVIMWIIIILIIIQNVLKACNVQDCLIHRWDLNNFVALWRLDAPDILELPLLAASSKMEIAPMAGKTWQPSHEPPHPQEDRHPPNWYTVESRGWGREGTKTAKCFTHNAPTSATLINKHYSPKHVEFHACASILKPLTNWLQSPLVVYMVINFV